MNMKTIIPIVLIVATLAIAGCFSFPDRVKDPTFSPAPGSYQGSVQVTLSSQTANAQIHYTLDGTTPTESSTLYLGPITLTSTKTVKAIGYLGSFLPSNVVTGTYTVTAPTPTAAAPTFSPAAGSYQNSVSVTMSSTTPGAQIRYTTNGAEPTSTSTLYSGPVTLTQTTTLKAKAFATGYDPSTTTSATYTITSPPQNSPVSRSFSTGTISPNGIVTVTLTKTLTAQQTTLLIEETVPAGWTITSGGTGAVQGNIIRWAELTGATSGSLTYTVRAPSTTGTGTWSGQYSINGASPANIGGSTNVVVQ